MLTIEVREERHEDIPLIRDVHSCAFGQEQESQLVDALRANSASLLSLVAILDGRLVGHVMYSPLSVGDRATGAALAPLAVHPDYQRRGVGGELVRVGTKKLSDAGCPFIIVLGHAEYYPRFGFERASAREIRCEWNVPDEVFMVLVLDEARMQGIVGLAKYRPEFSAVT